MLKNAHIVEIECFDRLVKINNDDANPLFTFGGSNKNKTHSS